jgi:hypothetical protein
MCPWALGALCILAVGCSFSRYKPLPQTGATLEGTVTYGKDKVPVAMIIATGDGGSAQSFVDDAGRYKLDNVPLGEVRLAVNVGAGRGQLMSKKMSGQHVPKVVDVPGKYADPATTDIKTTINKGSNTFDIVIPR